MGRDSVPDTVGVAVRAAESRGSGVTPCQHGDALSVPAGEHPIRCGRAAHTRTARLPAPCHGLENNATGFGGPPHERTVIWPGLRPRCVPVPPTCNPPLH